MDLPPELNPYGEIEILLPSGRTVTIPRARPVFRRWRGTQALDDYEGKEILECSGRPAFAELATLWAFHAAGWQGVWVDTHGGQYRTDFWNAPPVQVIPPPGAHLLARVNGAAGPRNGSWDVYCWRDDRALFALVLRLKRDHFTANQLHWLEAAFMTGLTHDSFLVVEWALEDDPKASGDAGPRQRGPKP